MSGRTFGGWTVGALIGEGGNGEVYAATRADVEAAIKFLIPTLLDKSRGERFRHEIEAMTSCSDVAGILPVLDHHVPDRWTIDDPPWFVMPLATPLKDMPDKAQSLVEVVELCLAVALILERLHERGMAHRDVKPGNILYWDNRWVLGDLGLADYPGKSEITITGERLGPRDYMAPEMMDAKNVSDPRPADVFSLAKVLWKLATKHNYPLPGPQSQFEPSSRLSQSARPPHPRSHQLDPLIDRATRLTPSERLTMREVVKELETWLIPTPIVGVIGLDLAAPAAMIRAAHDRFEARRFEAERKQQWHDKQYARLSGLFDPFAAECRRLMEAVFIEGVELFRQKEGPILLARVTVRTWEGGVSMSLQGNLQLDRQLLTGQLLFACGVPNCGGELWRKVEPFLVGGSEEAHLIAQFEKEGREALIRGIQAVARHVDQTDT